MRRPVAPLPFPFPVEADHVCVAEDVPAPWMAKVNGFSPVTSFATLTVVDSDVAAEGVNLIWNVVLPDAAMVVDGWETIAKSDALPPETLTAFAPKVTVVAPGFDIVNVRVIEPPLALAVPKSVSFPVIGLTEPLAIDVLFPEIPINVPDP